MIYTNANFKWTMPAVPTAVSEFHIPGCQPPYLHARNRKERRAAEKKLKELHPGCPIVTIKFK